MSIQPIGPTPADENCEQYGVPGYDPIKARKECCAFLHQLRRMHGTEPDGARLIVSTADGYPEVAVKFDCNCKEAVEYMLLVEGNSPQYWDELAMADLGWSRKDIDARIRSGEIDDTPPKVAPLKPINT